MYTGVCNMFATWAAIGAQRGNWRTRVANSWAGAPCSGLHPPSSACLLSYPQTERTRNTDIGRRGGAVLGATPLDMGESRCRQFRRSVQRLLWPMEVSSPRIMKTDITEQHRTIATSSLGDTTAAASPATRMRRCAVLSAAARSNEIPAERVMALSLDGDSQHTRQGAPTATPPNDKVAFTGTTGRKRTSPITDPTGVRPPLRPSSTEPLAGAPPATVVSFHGSPKELQDRLRGAKALVFFYKASCVPCAVIRSKLLHAVAGAGGSGGGATSSPSCSEVLATEVAEVDGALSHLPDHLEPNQREPASLTGVPAAAAMAAHSEAKDSNATGATTASPPGTTMTLEDQKSCDVACRVLGDATKPFDDSVILITVDTNENAEVTALHDIRSLPTFMAYRNGCIVGRFEGSHEDEINKLVDLLAGNSTEGNLTIDNGKTSPPQPQQGTASKCVSGD
ncbi:hypothetical protein, conserved [Leishmania tarentolae]|uniref:Thioredoxin domain-containing protein n=1 Tax=Leishmania tarentolae TaxID=5689 RepID=A0A640KN16_LEITA|nr:hypothetical protein, conserved [Leishmania tarentolae]